MGNFLNRFLHVNLTKSWEFRSNETREEFRVNIELGKFGSFRLGDNLDQARIFGKPDKFIWEGIHGYRIFYTDPAFSIDFDKNRSYLITFFISNCYEVMDIRKIKYAKPQIENRLMVTSEISKNVLEKIFGTLRKVDPDGSVLDCVIDGVVHEFEFEPLDRLARWAIYKADNSTGQL